MMLILVDRWEDTIVSKVLTHGYPSTHHRNARDAPKRTVAYSQRKEYLVPMSPALDALRRAIEHADETPYAIAQGCGVHRSQLSRLMSGENALSFASAEKVARYLGLEIVIRERQPRRKRR